MTCNISKCILISEIGEDKSADTTVVGEGFTQEAGLSGFPTPTPLKKGTRLKIKLKPRLREALFELLFRYYTHNALMRLSNRLITSSSTYKPVLRPYP